MDYKKKKIKNINSKKWKRKLIILIGFLSIVIGIFSSSILSFTSQQATPYTFTTALSNKKNPPATPASNPQDNNLNSQIRAETSDKIYWLEPGYIDPTTINDFTVALGIYQRIQANFKDSLLIKFPDFKQWAEDMLVKPILDPTIARASFFTPQILNAFNEEFNGIGPDKTIEQGEHLLINTPGSFINIFRDTTIPWGSSFQIKVGELNYEKEGIITLGSSELAGQPQVEKEFTLVIDNSKKQLETESINQAIANNNIFYRADNDFEAGADLNKNIFTFTKDTTNKTINIFVNLDANLRTASIWNKAPEGPASTLEPTFKFGELDHNQPTTSIIPAGSVNTVPVFGQNVRPLTNQPPNNDNVLKFWIKKDESFITTLSVNNELIYKDFIFSYSGAEQQVLLFNDIKKEDVLTKLDIKDTAWGPDPPTAGTGKYQFKYSYNLSADGSMAEVTVRYNPLVFRLTERGKDFFTTNNAPSNYNYQGIFFRKPASFTPTSNQNVTIDAEKSIDKEKLAKIALGKIFEQWAGIDNQLTLSNNLTLTDFQGIKLKAQGGFNVDGVKQNVTKLNGNMIYQTYLNEQTRLMDQALTDAKFSEFVHGDKADDTYYQFQRGDPQKTILTFISSKFMDNQRVENQVNDVQNIVEKYKDVNQITADEILQIEQDLTIMVSNAMQQDFQRFKLILYSKVYKAYGMILQENGFGNPNLLPTDLLHLKTGKLENDTAAFEIGNTVLNASATSDDYGIQIANSIFQFIDKNNLGATLFNQNYDTLAAYNNIKNNNFKAVTNKSMFDNLGQQESKKQVFRLYNTLFTWLKIPVNNILDIALDSNIDYNKMEKTLGDNMQGVITKLVDIKTQSNSIQIYNKTYTNTNLQVLVANNNIRTALNQIDTKNKSAAFKDNLAVAKNTDWTNYVQSKRFAIATENYDLSKYVSAFSDGSKTILFINQIKKLDFKNPKIFILPKPTEIFRKLLDQVPLILKIVFFVVGLTLLTSVIGVSLKTKRRTDGSVTTNQNSRKFIYIVSGVIIVIAITLILFSILYMAGAIGSGIHFMSD